MHTQSFHLHKIVVAGVAVESDAFGQGGQASSGSWRFGSSLRYSRATAHSLWPNDGSD